MWLGFIGPTISGFSSVLFSSEEVFELLLSGETASLSVSEDALSFPEGFSVSGTSSAFPLIRYSKLKGTPPKAEEYADFPASSL